MYLVRTPIQPARHAIRRVIRVITLEEVFAREKWFDQEWIGRILLRMKREQERNERYRNGTDDKV